MMIVRLQGGVGNQMFQYAFAMFLEKKYSTKVYFDLSIYEEQKKLDKDGIGKVDGVCIRKYELDIFKNIKIEFFSNKMFLYRLLSFFHITRKNFIKKIKEKDPFEIDDKFFNLLDISRNKILFFEGYFQNEKYFKFFSDEIKLAFKLPQIKSEDEYNRALLDKISSKENSVFIHVRRDDYVYLGRTIADKYYERAINYVCSKLENPYFFVFCAEDPEFIKKNFKFNVNWELVGEKNKGGDVFFENMRLMMACKHAIIANSSYSWWAAWLSDYNGKIVIAPSPWLKQQGSDSIICDSWLKISTD